MTNINNTATAKRCLGAMSASVVALALAACATTTYSPAAIDNRNELLAAHLSATNGIAGYRRVAARDRRPHPGARSRPDQRRRRA